MDDLFFKQDKDYAEKPVKKVHCIDNKLIIVIAEEIANRAGIDSDNNTWLEQEVVEDGIFMRISTRFQYTS
jgi:hypothetical protein